jgi:hypothetical protein
LLVDGACRIGHIRSNESGKEVHEIDSLTDNGRALVGLVLGKVSIQLACLEEAVALLGNGKDGRKACPQFNSLEFLIVPNKELVDLVSEDVEGSLLVCGLIWHDAIVMLGVDELQNPANKVA